ncbi:ERF family protein [Lacrimispora saccharolytica]|nr:ERF family protein [Lacrimispora saccharolytica]
MDQSDIVIGGFNNKHYDDWVTFTMLLGGSNIEVKRHSDYIIVDRKDPWTFPFVQYKKRPFRSFDLKDDISDKGISLKAIEGNLYLPIVESSVPFDINRPLTPEELEEVIRYCKTDVDATVALYHARNEYITSKKIVGAMYGVNEFEAMGLTNAKLSARVLNAKYVDRNDERDYRLPDNLDPEIIPKKVLDFFMQIKDKTIPSTKLFGTGKQGSKGMTLDIWFETSGGRCPVTYAWGGVHGAKPAFTATATADRLIVNFDVASLYPNSMINFGYCSRSMADPDAYKKLVQTRLAAKKAGDSEKAEALKLVVNTVYGAMLNLYNDLADRWAGRSVCITNQLAMTQLIVMLAQRCKSIDFININTDGIMFFIDKEEDSLAAGIVSDWCKITGFEMERDDFAKIIQKDVNNYIGIKTDGKMKTKGGYVSLYKGGNFKTNSLQIIDKAIVEYLVNGIDPEETIRNEKDIFKFQNIVKTGSTYEGSYHYINGERFPIQKVNRIYAVKNPQYGKIVKGKWITEKRHKDKATGKMISELVDPPVWQEETIQECPDHAFTDNENVLTVDDLDLDYYIEMAKGRIDKYINLDRKIENKLKKIKEVITVMATAKAEKTEDIRSSNVYEKLMEARKRFLEAGIKKSGKNIYAEFKYFTLEDIIPIKTEIYNSLGLADVISFGTEVATLTLFNTDNPEECIEFMSPIRDDESMIKNPIQKLGAVETYVRRYLYMLVLDIVEADAVEAVTDKPDPETGKTDKVTVKKSNRPATAAERQETKKDLIDQDGQATDTQIKAIKNGLKKLRSKDAEKYEKYVTEAVKRIKAGLKKNEAEDLLIEIGDKVEEA